MAGLERQTEENTRLRLWIAFDYGGRAELVEAARKLVESGVEPREIDENVLAGYLYAPDMPDPDLLIRTSGELRISNFLLWQIAYTELVFLDGSGPTSRRAISRGAAGVRPPPPPLRRKMTARLSHPRCVGRAAVVSARCGPVAGGSSRSWRRRA
jgi:hypothetical protein